MDVGEKKRASIRSMLLAGMLLLGVGLLAWVAFGQSASRPVAQVGTPLHTPTVTATISLTVIPSRTHILLERSATPSPTITSTTTMTLTPTVTLSSSTPNTPTITGTRPTSTRTYAPGEKSPTPTWFIRLFPTRTPVNLRTPTRTKTLLSSLTPTLTVKPTEPSISSSFTPTPTFTPTPLSQIGLSASTTDSINVYLLQIFSGGRKGTLSIINNALFWDWSPDGSRLVYEAVNNAVPDGRLWLADAYGGTATLLPNQTDGSNSQARWLAVGTAVPPEQWIIFRNLVTQNQVDTVDLFRIHPDGTALENITDDTDGVDPDWSAAVESDPALSPDGKRLAFIQDGEIYMMNMTSGERTQVTTDGKIKASPAWSPDGTKMAWAQKDVTTDTTQWEIYSADISLNSPWKLTNIKNCSTNAADDIQPDWSVDGLKILFISARDPAGVYELTFTGDNNIVVNKVDTSLAGEQNPRYQPIK